MTYIRAKKSQSNYLMRDGEMGCVVTLACAGVHVMRNLMVCTPHQALFGQSDEKERAEHAAHMGGGEVYTGFWWGNWREDHL